MAIEARCAALEWDGGEESYTILQERGFVHI